MKNKSTRPRWKQIISIIKKLLIQYTESKFYILYLKQKVSSNFMIELIQIKKKKIENYFHIYYLL